MNERIKLSASWTPGTDRTRLTRDSGKLWAKSMLGVFFEVTHRSAGSRSMVMVALPKIPRNSPICTKISVTAKATPETVIRKRSLSWSRFFRARSTILFLRPGQAVHHRVHHQLRALSKRPPVDPDVLGHHQVQGHHAVQRGPQRLGDQVRVFQARAEDFLLQSIAHH